LALPLTILQQQLSQLGEVARRGKNTAVGALDAAPLGFSVLKKKNKREVKKKKK